MTCSTCLAGDDPMLTFESHAESPVGQDLVDLALHRHDIFIRQTSSLRTNNCPQTGESRRGATQHVRGKATVKAVVKFRRNRR